LEAIGIIDPVGNFITRDAENPLRFFSGDECFIG
jgi:hypothetical protein